jgi:hypothetical protein
VLALHGEEVAHASSHRLAVAEEEEERHQHEREVHDREEDVARQRGRLADDLVGDPVGGAQEEIGEVDRELIEERGDANPQPAEPRAAGLLHQLHELALLDGLLETAVGARRLPHEERAEQEGGQDHPHRDRQHEHQRGEPTPPAKQRDQPIRQRIEGEGEDRRPHQRREEGRHEEVELVEQEQEDGEEERREELLPRHAGRTLTARSGHHNRALPSSVGLGPRSRLDRPAGDWYRNRLLGRERRHVAQWESASLTRKRPAVQSRPCLSPS